MTKKPLKWHEEILLAILSVGISMFISFKGFSKLIGGRIYSELGSSKTSGIAYAMVLLEQSYWRFLVVIVFVLLGVINIRKGLCKYRKRKRKNRYEEGNRHQRDGGLGNLSRDVIHDDYGNVKHNKMRVVSNFKEFVKPLIFSLKSDGRFELEVSVIQHLQNHNATDIQFTCIGVDGESTFAWNLQLKRLTVHLSTDDSETFIPARLAIIPLPNPKYRKPFVSLISKKLGISDKMDLTNFIGLELDLEESEKFGLFSIERLLNEKFRVTAKSESTQLYFEFGIEFDFPSKRIKLFETDISYRTAFINSILV